MWSPGKTYESSHLGLPTGTGLSVDGNYHMGRVLYTSMSKGEARVGGSTSHTPGMAGRG